jgi:hypothetical protein
MRQQEWERGGAMSNEREEEEGEEQRAKGGWA